MMRRDEKARRGARISAQRRKTICRYQGVFAFRKQRNGAFLLTRYFFKMAKVGFVNILFLYIYSFLVIKLYKYAV